MFLSYQVEQELARGELRLVLEEYEPPPLDVNVVYSQGVPLKKGTEFDVFGNVRKGRTPEMNDNLRNMLNKEIVSILNATPGQLEISLFEVPARWVMEGGKVLPEPGEEDQCEWLKEAHRT